MTISFFRFDGLFARLWAFAQMGLARPALRRHPDVGFWHLLGTGSGEGFTPLPNTGVYAILATWPNLNAARAAGATQPFARYHRRASEAWTLTLTPTTARGQWSRETPFTVVAAAAKGCGPVVALTRASIRARSLWHFWSRAPAISRMIGTNSDVIFKAGLGEHPFASQITFSIWPDAGRMAALRHRDRQSACSRDRGP
ncbi:MAG: spheroidene monooxygenase [Pseudomonadota bacterium]